MTALEEPVEAPPGEKVEINRMADKLKGAIAAMKQPAAAKPAAIAPPEADPAPAAPDKPGSTPAPAPTQPVPAAPAEPPKPDKEKNPARENFAKLESELKRSREEAAKLKSEYEPAKAKLAELQAQLESTSKLQPEYERIKQQKDEYEKIVKEFYVERDPQFQAHYGQRISTAVLEAKEAVGGELAGKIESVLQVPSSAYRDAQVAELAETLNDFQKAALVSAYTELKRAERERKAELQKASENYQKLQEVQSRRQQEDAAKAAESRTALLNHVNNQIEPELVDTDPELAKSIKENVKKMVSGEMDAKGYTNVLVYAAKGQKLEVVLKARDEQIAKLEAQLAEMQTAQPSLQGGGSPAPKGKPGEFEDIGSKFRKARDGK